MMVRVKKVHDDAIMPKRMTSGSSGFDLSCYTHGHVWSGATVVIPIGLCLEIPEGYEGQIRSRSGIAARDGIIILNSPGTIDSDYRGEIMLMLHNVSGYSFTYHPGDRLAQLIIVPSISKSVTFSEVKVLSSTFRGDGGLGSTGVGDKTDE